MGKIDIEYLTAGMVLEDSVKDLHGRILLKAGSAIAEKHIRILKMWGVVEVTAVDAGAANQEASPANQIDPDLLEWAANEASVLFRHTDVKGIFVSEIFRLSTLRIAKTKSKEQQDAY